MACPIQGGHKKSPKHRLNPTLAPCSPGLPGAPGGPGGPNPPGGPGAPPEPGSPASPFEPVIHKYQPYHTSFHGPTQPPTLSGTKTECQPRCGDVLRLGSKGRYDSFHLWINVWVAGIKTV